MSGRNARQLLLVEDNRGDADYITALLEGMPSPANEIVHVETLHDATSLLRLDHRDLAAILLDLRLPDASGVECVEVLRALASDTPIVVLTGMEDEALARACLGAGAQDYLSKQEVRAHSLWRALEYAKARCEESSQRRRADELQTRLAAIIEASRDAIVSCDVEWIITSWNPAAAAIFGVPAGDALGQPASLLLPLAASAETPLSTLPTAGPQELVHSRADGSVVVLSMVASPLRDPQGTTVGVAAIYRDITEQKALEAQVAASDRMVSIGTIAAGVAHEINNPLAAVVANLHVARERISRATLEQGIRDARDLALDMVPELADAQEAADRVAYIVRELKVFTRAEDERLGPVDLHRAVDSALRIASHLTRHRARVVRDATALPPVLAGEARLGQLLLNLVMNAAQAIPEGNPEGNVIRIETAVVLPGQVSISVSDTGCGMPPEVQRRLFTAFFTTKPPGVGTGLGLAISQRIATSFGGRITFESEVGKGSRFTLTLRATEPAPPAPPTPARLHLVASPRLRILVIDDEAVVLRVIARVLGDEHDLVTTTDPRQALERLAQGEDFDLILCDLTMPHVSGTEFVERLRLQAPDLARRVVFMTGGAFTDQARAFIESNPNRHVSKPFDAAQLRALVRELASESR